MLSATGDESRSLHELFHVERLDEKLSRSVSFNYCRVLVKAFYTRGVPTFVGKGPWHLLWAGSWAVRVKFTINAIPNSLNYFIIFRLCV